MKKLLFIFLASSLIAAPVSKKSFYSYSDFKLGELKGTALNIDGTITLTNKIQKITEFSETFIWCSVFYNGNIYLSAGEKGKIYQYDPITKKSPKLLTFFEEGTVYSLGIFNGKLYAGVSPTGKLFEIDLSTGKKTEYIETNSKYIWQIKTTNKYIYLACGIPGKIIRLDKNKIRKDFAKNLDDHIESLIIEDSTLYFGTSPEGYILKSNSIDHSYLLYDSPFKEIKNLKWFNNKLYAICFNGKPENTTKEKIKPAQIIKETQPLRGAIVTIDKKNLPNILYKFNNLAPMSMTTTKQGVLIGTGHSGKLLFIDKEENLFIKGEVNNGQITDFFKINNIVYFTTSNSANLYSIDNGLELTGEYISKPFDAYLPVNWGNFYFTSENSKETRVEYMIRGGNSASPDTTWTKWRLIKNGTKPNLPVSSKIQWKVKLISHLNSSTPKFLKTEFYYREVNYKPLISKTYILPSGFSIGENAKIPKNEFIPVTTKKLLSGFTVNIGTKFGYQKGVRSFLIVAKDKNKDSLEYKYSLLNKSGKEIILSDFNKKTYYSLNTESIPEGSYKLKVQVRDKINNFPDFYTVTKKSQNFIVDNTAPSISKTTMLNGKLIFTVSDNLSVIEKVMISTDFGKTFFEVFPNDKISDSKKETYSINSQGKQILIKVFDSLGNTNSRFGG